MSKRNNDDNYYYNQVQQPPLKKREIEFLNYDVNVNSLNDIINLIENNDIYNYEYTKLKNILNDIKELNNMIGLHKLKESIGQQIMFCIQNNNTKDDLLHTVLTGSPGCGKCMGYDTKILMFDGTIKKVQDIKIGDVLMGDDSTKRKVLNLGRGRDEMYKISNIKGDEYVVNSEHILCLKYSRNAYIIDRCNRMSYQVNWFDNELIKNQSMTYSYKNKNKTEIKKEAEECLKIKEKYNNKDVLISVKDFLKLPKTVQQRLKGYKTHVDFNEITVKLDPYYIGLWLGNGTSKRPDITTIDKEIINYIHNYAEQSNGKISYVSDITYGIIKCDFIKYLREYDILNNKHIPYEYKCNSKENRLKLLAGLLDSDGYLHENCYEIIQKNKILSDDILYLARSLGFAAYQSECKKSCMYKGEKKEGIYYRVNISGSGLEEIPVLCKRKKAKPRQQIKDALKSGITITSIGIDDYYGFELDGNHKYILDNFIVTHNTKVAGILAKIFSKLLNNSKFYKFKIVSRSDLIGEYLGQTAVKTQKVIDESVGGVLFIDEAYSLGTCKLNGGGDTYSKECIDTIVNNLTLKKFICIIAGYKHDIDEYWFGANKGMERRFPWRYDIEKYTHNELFEIFEKQVKDIYWKIDNDKNTTDYLINIFKNNKKLFENSGGDTAILLTKCKIHHSTRVFCHKYNEKRILNIKDIKNGFEKFKDFKHSLQNNDNNVSLSAMYL